MRYRAGIAAVFIVGSLLLTVIYGEALREQVIRPLLYGLWLLWLRLQGLPFDPIWAVFLGIAALAVYLGVIDLFLRTDSQRTPQQRFSSPGPIWSLSRKIRLSSKGDLARWNLHRDLRQLAIDWIALHDNISASEARRRFHAGQTLGHLQEVLLLDFPDPEKKPARRLSKKTYLRDLAKVLEELEIFASYGYHYRRR